MLNRYLEAVKNHEPMIMQDYYKMDAINAVAHRDRISYIDAAMVVNQLAKEVVR